MLLTDVWLGIRKKYTAAAIIATAAVRTSASFMTFTEPRFAFIVPVPPNPDLPSILPQPDPKRNAPSVAPGMKNRPAESPRRPVEGVRGATLPAFPGEGAFYMPMDFR